MNYEYKCEHSKLNKIYFFKLNSFSYSIILERDNKKIFQINKKNMYKNEKEIIIKEEIDIHNELKEIKHYLKRNKKNQKCN